MKAAEDSRTPKRCRAFPYAPLSARFWREAVLCRFLGVVSSFIFVPGFAQTNQPIALAEVPLKSRSGDLLVETRINSSEPLLFKLDSGFGVTTIHPNRVESLNLERVGHMTIIGIAGEDRKSVV